jgi:DNA-binding transcriptional LysR family regulator
MDRIEAMRVFIQVIDEGSLAAAARKLKRSPASISRAIAFLEGQLGVGLLYRTTRSVRLSEPGERYAASCRRILAELEQAEVLAGGERIAPRGVLTISAPPIYGEDMLRPIIDDFLDAYPTITIRLLLLDRPVNLVEEGVDVALRIAHLQDSSLIATRVGNDIRRVVVAAPAYLESRPPIREPADLRSHEIIAFENFGLDTWTFKPVGRSSVPRTVQFSPRITVNSVRASLASAIDGHGLTRLYSYHVAKAVRKGQLRIVLPDAEFPPVPAHLVSPQGRASVPKVRAFLDFTAPKLRAQFTRLAAEARSLP